MLSVCFVGRGALPKASRLELTFHTAELREVCEKREVAATVLGYAAARELAERLADIEAFDTVLELCLLLGDAICERSGTGKCLHLNSGFRIVFTSAHPPSGASSNPSDWKKVSRVKIKAIERING